MGTNAMPSAAVLWNGRWYIVVYQGVEYARFSVDEKKGAQDFANGFNCGLGRRNLRTMAGAT